MARLLTDHLLSVLIFLPSAAAVLLAFFPERAKGAVRGFTLAVSGLGFLLAARLFLAFRPDAGFQFNESAPWIPAFNIHWFVGVDGISLLMVVLTNFLMPVVILSSTRFIQEHVKAYHIAFLVLQTGMLGSFLALDLFLFYIFWELMLIPMYLIIGVWGGKQRIYAAVKFFIFTAVGSFLMFLAILWMVAQRYAITGGLDFAVFSYYPSGLDAAQQLWPFLAFTLAFAIKVPMFPFHTWLPDAHTEAPAGGSIILAGVLLKLGAYGMLRFSVPMFPAALAECLPWLLALSVVGILYGAWVCFAQDDLKKLIAYSSVSHLAFVTLGIFALTPAAVSGAVLQMVNHGLSTGALFLLVGILYERRHTRMMADFGGLAKTLPVYSALFLVVTLSSVGLPGLNGFWGEFLVLAGTFQASPWAAGFAASGVIFAAVYLLTAVRRVFFGAVTHEENKGLADLDARELFCTAALIVPMVWIGVYPKFFLDKITPAIEHYLTVVKGLMP
jgi:NADH-quinone oxidoreductase subunit M